jgi:transcriptional regulator with XRE-family HTH domain
MTQVKNVKQSAKKNRRPLIVELTRRPDVSLSDIARRAGCTLSFVSACAYGRRRPTRKVREAAEALLGYPAEELFPRP